MATDSSRQPGLQLLTNEAELTPSLSSVLVWGREGAFHPGYGITSRKAMLWEPASRALARAQPLGFWITCALLPWRWAKPWDISITLALLTLPLWGTGSKPTRLFPSEMPWSVLLPYSRKTQEGFPQLHCVPNACGLGLRYPTLPQVDRGTRWWGESHPYGLVSRLEVSPCL